MANIFGGFHERVVCLPPQVPGKVLRLWCVPRNLNRDQVKRPHLGQGIHGQAHPRVDRYPRGNARSSPNSRLPPQRGDRVIRQTQTRKRSEHRTPPSSKRCHSNIKTTLNIRGGFFIIPSEPTGASLLASRASDGISSAVTVLIFNYFSIFNFSILLSNTF